MMTLLILICMCTHPQEEKTRLEEAIARLQAGEGEGDSEEQVSSEQIPIHTLSQPTVTGMQDIYQPRRYTLALKLVVMRW